MRVNNALQFKYRKNNLQFKLFHEPLKKIERFLTLHYYSLTISEYLETFQYILKYQFYKIIRNINYFLILKYYSYKIDTRSEKIFKIPHHILQVLWPFHCSQISKPNPISTALHLTFITFKFKFEYYTFKNIN